MPAAGDAVKESAMSAKNTKGKKSAKVAGDKGKKLREAQAEIGARIAKLDGGKPPRTVAEKAARLEAAVEQLAEAAPAKGKGKIRTHINLATLEVVEAPSTPAAKKSRGKQKPKTEKRMSALDAAAFLVGERTGVLFDTKSLIAEMESRGLWSSPGGKTPGATLHAAISREIASKGDASRFRKGGRGLWQAAKGGAK